MILTPKYCWERVQKHRITLRMQYHDLRGRIGAHMAGDRKKTVKKVQNTTFRAFFGGGLVQTLHTTIFTKSTF